VQPLQSKTTENICASHHVLLLLNAAMSFPRNLFLQQGCRLDTATLIKLNVELLFWRATAGTPISRRSHLASRQESIIMVEETMQLSPSAYFMHVYFSSRQQCGWIYEYPVKLLHTSCEQRDMKVVPTELLFILSFCCSAKILYSINNGTYWRKVM